MFFRRQYLFIYIRNIYLFDIKVGTFWFDPYN